MNDLPPAACVFAQPNSIIEMRVDDKQHSQEDWHLKIPVLAVASGTTGTTISFSVVEYDNGVVQVQSDFQEHYNPIPHPSELYKNAIEFKIPKGANQFINIKIRRR